MWDGTPGKGINCTVIKYNYWTGLLNCQIKLPSWGQYGRDGDSSAITPTKTSVLAGLKGAKPLACVTCLQEVQINVSLGKVLINILYLIVRKQHQLCNSKNTCYAK